VGFEERVGFVLAVPHLNITREDVAATSAVKELHSENPERRTKTLFSSKMTLVSMALNGRVNIEA
jgi:hypothetical protein